MMPTTRGLASFVVAAGLAVSPAMAQNNNDQWAWEDDEYGVEYDEGEHYEWEAGEGIHEEEWYDPTDWFDDDDGGNRVDYEYDYSNYYGDDDWDYDYGYDYDYDYDDQVGYDWGYDDEYEFENQAYWDDDIGYDYDYEDDYGFDDEADWYENEPYARDEPRGMRPQQTRAARNIIRDWPRGPRQTAEQMLDKYGAPHGVTPDMLVWRETGPFVKTVLYSNPVEHNFPVPHKDYLQQYVNFDVPADKMDEIAKFDGSIIVYLTDGIMSARCHKEPMNTLALNLAAMIADGELSVEEARRKYARTAKAFAQGDRLEITQRLTFNTASRNTEKADAPDSRYRMTSAEDGDSQ